MNNYFLRAFYLVALITSSSVLAKTINSEDKGKLSDFSYKVQIDNPLLGTWKLQHIQYIYEDEVIGVEKSIPGSMHFSESNYVLTYSPWRVTQPELINDPWRLAATPYKVDSSSLLDMAKNALQTMVFNSGNYTFDAHTVTTTTDVAKVQGFKGGKQFFSYNIEGNTLDITLYDETYPEDIKPAWHGKVKVRYVLEKET